MVTIGTVYIMTFDIFNCTLQPTFETLLLQFEFAVIRVDNIN